MAEMHVLGSKFDRKFRQELNENFDNLSDSFTNAVDIVAKEAFDLVVDSAKIEWLSPVSTFSDLNESYPDADEGKTVMVRDTGKVYRRSDGKWEEIQQIDAGPVNEVDSRLTAQLAEKAAKTDTDMALSQKRDKTSLIGIGDLTQEVKEGMTGGSVAVVGEEAVGKVNLQDNAVSPEKTNFLKRTYNLFNPKNMKRGIQLNPDTGAEEVSLAYTTSEFIDVKPNTDYYISGIHGFHRYDETGKWLSGTTNDIGVRNTLGAAKIKVSVLNSAIYSLMIVEGISLPSYVENGYLSDFVKTQYQLKNSVKVDAVNSDSYEKNYSFPFEKIDLLNLATLSSNNRMIINDEYEYRFRNRRKSYKLDLMTSVSTLTITPPSAIQIEGISEFIVIAFIEDVSKVTNIQLKVTGTLWTRQPIETLKNGWNILRYQVTAGDVSTWTTASSVTLDFYFNAVTTVFLSDVLAIRPTKAKILFINDHGYHNFKQIAYPQLKSLGIPTTWAINPGRLGEGISSVESILTQSDIDELAYDPYSEFSVHNWNPIGNPTENMTADQLLADTHKCLTYLKKNGILPRYPWRAAFTQNLAKNHTVLQPFIDAYATPTGNAGIELYPFRNRYNVNRDAIHGTSRDSAYFDEVFDKLKKTRSLYVCYTHGLDDTGGIHITNAQLDYFLSKISTAVSEGWLEGTTYSKLRGQYSFLKYEEVL